MNSIFVIGCLFAALQCAHAVDFCSSTASNANNVANKANNVIKRLVCLSDSQTNAVDTYSRQYNSYKVALSRNKCKQKIIPFSKVPVSCCASAASGANSAANKAKSFITGSACLNDSQIKNVGTLVQQYNAYKNLIQKNKCKQTTISFPKIPASCCFVALSGMNNEVSNILAVAKGKQCISLSDATRASSYADNYEKFKKNFTVKKCTQAVPGLPVVPRTCPPLPPAQRPPPSNREPTPTQSPPASKEPGFSTCPLNSDVDFSSVQTGGPLGSSVLRATFPNVCNAVGTIPTVLAEHPLVINFQVSTDGSSTENLSLLQVIIGRFTLTIGATDASFNITYNDKDYVIESEADFQQFISPTRRKLLYAKEAHNPTGRRLADFSSLCDVEKAVCSLAGKTVIKIACFFINKYSTAIAADCRAAVALLLETGQLEAVPLALAPCAAAAGLYAACNLVVDAACELAKRPSCSPTPAPTPGPYGDPAACGYGPEWAGCLDANCNALACCIIHAACEALECSSKDCSICASSC